MKETIVIIPTYNEAESLPRLIPEIRKHAPEVEILVVDDNSPDGTADVAHSLGCKTLRRVNEKGLSSAVISGIKTTANDNVIIMDADGQHPPSLLPKIIRQLKNHELVVASRYCKGGSLGKDWSALRIFISRVTNSELRFLLPHIKDRLSGCFGFQRKILDGQIDNLDSNGYKIGLEIMVKGNYKTSTEVPYTFQPRYAGATKFAKFPLMRDFLKQLIGLYLYKYRILRFTTVGGSGTVVNLVTLFLIEHFILHTTFEAHWGTVVADKSYLAAFIPAFFLSVVNNYVLNSLWTFSDRTAGKVGFPKYLLITSITLPLDLVLLYFLTEIVGIWYLLSAAIAIMVVFIIRYTVSKHWVWKGLK